VFLVHVKPAVNLTKVPLVSWKVLRSPAVSAVGMCVGISSM